MEYEKQEYNFKKLDNITTVKWFKIKIWSTHERSFNTLGNTVTFYV